MVSDLPTQGAKAVVLDDAGPRCIIQRTSYALWNLATFQMSRILHKYLKCNTLVQHEIRTTSMEKREYKYKGIWHIHSITVHFQITCLHIDGLEQEKRKSVALAMELRLSCTNPLIWYLIMNTSPSLLLVLFDIINAAIVLFANTQQ